MIKPIFGVQVSAGGHRYLTNGKNALAQFDRGEIVDMLHDGEAYAFPYHAIKYLMTGIIDTEEIPDVDPYCDENGGDE